MSNNNPYSEILFKALKYRPQLPVKPFEDFLVVRRWVTELLHWYNEEHRNGAMLFVTPAQSHTGEDKAMLAARTAVYEVARQAHPNRWSKQICNWRYKTTEPRKSSCRRLNALETSTGAVVG